MELEAEIGLEVLSKLSNQKIRRAIAVAAATTALVEHEKHTIARKYKPFSYVLIIKHCIPYAL